MISFLVYVPTDKYMLSYTSAPSSILLIMLLATPITVSQYLWPLCKFFQTERQIHTSDQDREVEIHQSGDSASSEVTEQQIWSYCWAMLLGGGGSLCRTERARFPHIQWSSLLFGWGVDVHCHCRLFCSGKSLALLKHELPSKFILFSCLREGEGILKIQP